MKHLTIIIHWKGPYTLDEIEEVGGGKGLYLLTGKRKYNRENKIQYCGITASSYKKRFRDHHKLKRINRDLKIWLGEIVYPERGTRKVLEEAERIIIYFWQPALNERKKVSLPNPTSVISHWFKRDGSPRINQLSIYKDLHDVLCWDGDYWRSGNLAVWRKEPIKKKSAERK